MATADDLVGVGLPPEVARLIGNTPNTLTCTGTTQGGAALIKAHATELSASASNTGAVFNSNSSIGAVYYLFCSSSTSAVVYAPLNETLNGAANGTITLAQNKAAIVWQYKNNCWASVLTA